MYFYTRSLSAIVATIFLSQCATTTKPSVVDQSISQGNDLVKQGLLREASQAYKKALKLNKNSVVARRNLGIVELKLKNYQSGVSNLEKIIGRYADDFDTNFWYAEGLRANDKYADAIFHYKKALEIKPEHSRSAKALAWSYYKTRYYSEALAVVKTLQKKNPQDPQTIVILARVLIKLDQPQQALTLLSKIKASINPDNLPFLLSVEGDAYIALNRCTDAITVYRDALKAQPLLPGPLLGLGRCHLDIGKTAQAIDYLERAVRIKPNYTEAVLALAKAYEDTDKTKSVRYYKSFKKLALKDPEYMDRIDDAKSKIARLSPKEPEAPKKQ